MAKLPQNGHHKGEGLTKTPHIIATMVTSPNNPSREKLKRNMTAILPLLCQIAKQILDGPARLGLHCRMLPCSEDRGMLTPGFNPNRASNIDVMTGVGGRLAIGMPSRAGGRRARAVLPGWFRRSWWLVEWRNALPQISVPVEHDLLDGA
jgi:hypothetical protein